MLACGQARSAAGGPLGERLRQWVGERGRHRLGEAGSLFEVAERRVRAVSVRWGKER